MIEKKFKNPINIKNSYNIANKNINNMLSQSVNNPIFMSVSESAKIGGVQNKTIRRAIKSNLVSYKITGNRYLVNLKSLIIYLHSKTKLKNKLYNFGIGQYIEKWKK